MKNSKKINIKLKHTKEEVLKVLDKFKPEEQAILIARYGLNNNKCLSGKDIIASLNLSISLPGILKKLNKLEERVDIYLSGKTWNPNISLKYSQEEIINYMAYFNDIEKKVITYFYGINLPKRYKRKSIGDLLEPKLSEKEIKQIINNIYNKIDKINNKAPERKLNLRLSKEEVKENIDYFKGKRKEIMILRYGLNGDNPHTISEINQILNLNTSRQNTDNIIHRAEEAIIKLRDKLNINIPKLNKEIKKYSKEDIILIINNFNDLEKQILIVLFNLDNNDHNLNELITVLNLNNIELESILTDLFLKINNLLNNKIKFLIKEALENIKINNNIISNLTTKEYIIFYLYYHDINYLDISKSLNLNKKNI